jgi:hypothetical protein
MRGEVKKIIVLAIITMFFITTFSSIPGKHLRYVNKDQGVSAYCNETTRNDKKWTFLAYLDGDMPDIEGSMMIYVNSMELIGSTSDVNIVVQADDCGIWNDQTRRYYIVHDDNPNVIVSPLADNDTSEKNMGDPQTLIDFVCWAVDKYPAENYCLTIFDHGDGWRAICSDITNGSYLNMSELKEAIIGISNHLGGKLDVLILDACNMGMLEVFYQIKDYVDISISSEIPTSYYDISYERILENLTGQPLLVPSEFAQKIVDSSYNTFNGIPTHVYFGVNMDKIEEITEVINELAQVLKNNMPSNSMIKAVHNYSLCWGGIQTAPYPHDIRRFAEKISDLVDNTDIKNKTYEIMEIIDNCVIRPHEGNNSYVDPLLHGIAIYFPPKQSDFEDAYKQLEFANDTQWDEFLENFYQMAFRVSQQISIQSSSSQLFSNSQQISSKSFRQSLGILKINQLIQIFNNKQINTAN